VNETVITVVGNVATEPKLRVTSTGVRVVSFRLASTERRYDKALRGWRDGDTVFYTVTCWRNTGENALDSVVSGQPMVVRGKLRNPSYEKEGQKMSYLEIEAYSLGHDISRGVSRFTRASQAVDRPELVPDDPDEIDVRDEPDGPGGEPVPVAALASSGRPDAAEELGSGSPSAA
jgi:single-strand DNA-binding protein